MKKGVTHLSQIMKTHKYKLILGIVTVATVAAGLIKHFAFSPQDTFSSLNQISLYAKSTEEFPGIDNNDRLKPDYSSYLNNITPAFLNVFAPKWNIKQFKQLLTKTIKQQEAVGNTGVYALKFTPAANTNFVIFGDLFGSLHSLVRDLEKIKELGIINDNLEIIKPNDYIIFNGNLINLSAYSLETINIALLLMQKNPNNVFYLKGAHEYKNYTEYGFAYGLDKEIEIKNKRFSNEQNPLKTNLLRFFDNLPLAIYLNTNPTKNSDFIRISNLSPSTCPLIDESNYADLLLHKSSNWQKIKITSGNKSNGSISLNAIIKSVDRIKTQMPTTGLLKLPDEKNATTWDITSSPNSTYKALLDFFYDAFCILSVDSNYNWKITLYNQDVNQKKGFQKSDFAFLNGTVTQKSNNGDTKHSEASKTIIKVGSLQDLTGGAKDICAKIIESIRCRIAQAVRTNELEKYSIQLTCYDHQYEPRLAKEFAKKLINDDKIDFILCPSGTAPTSACLPFIKEKKALFLFPYTGSGDLHSSEYPYLLFCQATYESEAAALIEYAYDKLIFKKFALFYQDDGYGRSALNAAKKTLERLGVTKENWIETSYMPNTLQVEKCVKAINNFGPDGLFLFAVTAPANELLSKLKTSVFKTAFALSPLKTDDFDKSVKHKGISLVHAHIVPNYDQPRIKLVNNYLDEMKRANSTPSDPGLLGYIATSIFLDALKQITEPVTKDKILEKIQSFNNYKIDGLELNFDPKTNEVYNKVWLDLSTNEWIDATSTYATPNETKEIKIGTLLDLSGGSFESGNALLKGMNLRIHEENATGGIKGQKIVLIAKDHQSDRKLSAQRAQEFIKEQIRTLLVVHQTGELASCIDLIRNKSLLVLFPNSGAGSLRQSDLSHLVFFKTSYENEVIALINYAIKNLMAKKVAIFYQDDPEITASIKSIAANTFKQNNMDEKSWLTVSYGKNLAEIQKAAMVIKDFSPEALIMFSNPVPATTLFSKLEYSWLIPRQILGVSSVDTPSFYSTIKNRGLNASFSHLFPKLSIGAVEIVNEFIPKAEANQISINDFSFQGYLYASLFIDILKQIDAPITNEKIIKKIESFKDYKYKGFTLTFDPKTRELTRDIWIEQPKGDWIYSPTNA